MDNGKTRRDFNKLAALAMGGVLAGATFGCKSNGEGGDGGGEKHACKGLNNCKGHGGCASGDAGCAAKNSCKGKGGCATATHHQCAGNNECKGQGGCKSGDHGCAGKNSCKGKGGCHVPVKH